jgi:hypothetical protein
MCGGFFLKFSNTNVNSEDRTTLTHNYYINIPFCKVLTIKHLYNDKWKNCKDL